MYSCEKCGTACQGVARRCGCPEDTAIVASLSATCYGDGGVTAQTEPSLKEAFIRLFNSFWRR